MSEDLFEKNLELFSRFCPSIGIQLQNIDPSNFQFCFTGPHQLNLKTQINDSLIYIHSSYNVQREANKWFQILSPKNEDVIFIFGIGLGYYYDAIKPWLKQAPDRIVIFLEDNLAILYRFLETAKASEILSDPQVIIKGFHQPNESEWGQFRKDFAWIFWTFAYSQAKFTILATYAEERAKIYYRYLTQIQMNLAERKLNLSEMLTPSHELLFENFYRNLPYISGIKLTEDLFGKFKDIPAIICGAGSSIDSQISLLKEIQDYALIFGAGTGENALTRNGIHPHFAGGIDPNTIQESRQRTSFGIEIPYFNHLWFYHEAFKKTHGPMLYLAGESVFKVSDWFEKELDIGVNKNIFLELTSTNFCLQVSHGLGCNPIILAGVDLAYTEESRYTKGIQNHPVDAGKYQIKRNFVPKDAIRVKNTNNEDLHTNWGWISEGSSYTAFKHFNPEINLLNSSITGLPLDEIPTASLPNIREKYLKRQYDLKGWVHTEIQNASTIEADQKRIVDALEDWKNSLMRSITFCDSIMLELQQTKKINSNKIAFLQTALEGENSYIYLLNQINLTYVKLFERKIFRLRYNPEAYSEKILLEESLNFEMQRYNFIKRWANFHLKTVGTAIQEWLQEQRIQKRQRNNSSVQDNKLDNSIYQFSENYIRIKDEELQIDLSEYFNPVLIPNENKQSDSPIQEIFTEIDGILEGQSQFYYPDGTVKANMFYKNNLLHGPSTFFSKNGMILSESWFQNGKRIGKSTLYYPSGKFYALLKYSSGELHGRQSYFFPDGTLKTTCGFMDGKLHGSYTMFYTNGACYREVNYKNGQLDGQEREWNSAGQLILEVQYKGNQPIGELTMRHSNGEIAKQIIFHENPEHFDIYNWDTSGHLINSKIFSEDKNISPILSCSNKLVQDIEQMIKDIKKIHEGPQ